jgi:hypothetical protein
MTSAPDAACAETQASRENPATATRSNRGSFSPRQISETEAHAHNPEYGPHEAYEVVLMKTHLRPRLISEDGYDWLRVCGKSLALEYWSCLARGPNCEHGRQRDQNH